MNPTNPSSVDATPEQVAKTAPKFPSYEQLKEWSDRDDATIAALRDQITSLDGTIDKSTDTILRLNEAWDKARLEAERWKNAYDIAHAQAAENGSQERRLRDALERIQKGRRADAWHEWDCRCHICSMTMREVRNVAAQAMSAGTAKDSSDEQ